jgi:hypothetical protein
MTMGTSKVLRVEDNAVSAQLVKTMLTRSDSSLEQNLKALELAAHLLPEDQEWIPLMRDVLRLPAWVLPAVQYVIGSGEWRESCDPLGSVSKGAFAEASRMGLSAKPAVRNASG